MSMNDDPSRDLNSLGGPLTSLPGMGGAGLDGGGSSTGGPSMSGTNAFSGADVPGGSYGQPLPDKAIALPNPATSTPPVLPDKAISTPQPSNVNVDPPAVSAPPVASTPDLPYAPANAAKGFDGGDLASPSGAPSMGGGAKVGLDGGGTAAGPGQFFADGGAVEDDGSDPQGAMGNDPITQMISQAMDSVDKTFQYGRQKNGLGGAQGAQGGAQQSSDPTPPTASADGDGSASSDPDSDDTPGSGASDQDDEGEGAQ